jgi:hypothetical protein
MVLNTTLPDTLYRVRVPTIATYTENEIEILGIPFSVVDGKRCKNDTMEMVNVYLPLDRIIDIFLNGFPILLIDTNEVGEIYEVLENYLSNSLNAKTTSLNRATVKEDRYDEIEKFLEEIFGYNKYAIVKSAITQNDGFNIGLNLFQSTQQQSSKIKTSKNSLLAGYADSVETLVNNDRPRTFIDNSNNLPSIDIENVRRNKRLQAYNIKD